MNITIKCSECKKELLVKDVRNSMSDVTSAILDVNPCGCSNNLKEENKKLKEKLDQIKEVVNK